MVRLILRRVLHLVIVVLGVYTALFFLLRLTGGPALLYVSEDAGPAQIRRVREQLGLADPLPVQYVRFLGRAMVGDFGLSLRYNQPALPLVLASVPATLELTAAALLVTALIGVPVGIVSATRRNSVADHLSLAASLVGQCVPTFWLGILLLPASGRGTLTHVLMPALTLGAYSAARVARLTRSSVLDVLGQEFVRTARSKGLAERAVILRHVLKNAAIPIVAILGLSVSTLLGGAVITETIFDWPGVGRLMVQAVFVRDYPIVQGTAFLIAAMVALITFVTDALYAWLDPRISRA
ncbi:MAG: ABC transporter permease [Candidatus Rokuibacteriota bacterium]|nr:MAG: ABC transporter permease [Candidatus Rokubacteria bacterium]